MMIHDYDESSYDYDESSYDYDEREYTVPYLWDFFLSTVPHISCQK